MRRGEERGGEEEIGKRGVRRGEGKRGRDREE